MTRVSIPVNIQTAVLTECGYRCAVPTCRGLLAIDIHHIVEVSQGGSNTLDNLIALCPTCHALFHRGTIKRESIGSWKIMICSLNGAFDRDSIELLNFLAVTQDNPPSISGDGVLRFARLISAGLALHQVTMQNGPLINYGVFLTQRGTDLINAWRQGDLQKFAGITGSIQV